MTRLAIFGAIALLSAAAVAQTPQPAPVKRPLYGAPLTAVQAQMAMAAAEAEAQRHDLPAAIAIVEPSGELVMFKKLDGVQYYSVDSAMNKARSAARLKRSTRDMQESYDKNPAMLVRVPGAVPAAGGVPIMVGGKIVGAIGASTGASLDADHQIAAAGAAAVK